MSALPLAKNDVIVVKVEKHVTVREVGTVPCKVCRKPHIYYDDPEKTSCRTWRDPEDGHPYEKMTAEQVVEFFFPEKKR